MAYLHALMFVAALAGVGVLPCLICLLIIRLDELSEQTWRAVRRWVRRHLARAKKPSEPSYPPIERIAADLRRLHRQRTGIATRSSVWFTAVQRAYDERLRVASAQLGVDQHLDGLTGVDLELERVRVEELLRGAGLATRDDKPERRR